MPRPIALRETEIYIDPLTDREVCALCFDGLHKLCNESKMAARGCRCAHHLAYHSRKPKKDTSQQIDIVSEFGTIEV
jgi:hypothetical protein